MKINLGNIPSALLYALSALVVAALAAIFKPGEAFVAVYWPLAFWTLAALDFYRSQVKEDGASELECSRYSFADRFIAYVLIAPFIFPARLLQLVPVKSRS